MKLVAVHVVYFFIGIFMLINQGRMQQLLVQEEKRKNKFQTKIIIFIKLSCLFSGFEGCLIKNFLKITFSSFFFLMMEKKF